MKPYYDESGITLYHADCREILPALEPDAFRLLWTDPPYGHCNQDGDLQSSRVGVAGGRQRPTEAILNDTPEAMRAAVDSALTLAIPLLNHDCCCCCCCAGGGGPSVTFAWLANRMDTAGLQFFHAVIWDKSGRGHGLGWRFRRNYEFVMVAHRATGKLAWFSTEPAVPNIFDVQPTDNTHHPTEKPVGLVTRFIDLTTQVGDQILDPFAGSGTTLVAAKLSGRRAVGIEMNERFCETAANRLSQGILFGAA